MFGTSKKLLKLNSNSGNSNNFLLSNRWRTHWISALYAIIWQI